MVFHSTEFIIFLVVVYVVYWLLKKSERQNILLFLGNCLFYGWWNPKYLILIFLSSLIDFYCGSKIYTSEPQKKINYLSLSIFSNLIILGVFKYYNFFAVSFASLFSFFGLNFSPLILDLLLPVGISYYTFQSMGYSFDIYRDEIKPEKKFTDFFVFISFFPQLVAGPIEKASSLLTQVKKERVFSWSNFQLGMFLLATGYFKKLVIADRLLPFVEKIFTETTTFNSGFTFIMGVFFFWVYLYCDFSGYCNIASGLARLLGFTLMDNFRNPFYSRSPSEYFRRWQTSLTHWITNYLLYPVAMKTGRPVMGLFAALFIMGLWHGASWTNVTWGILIFFLILIYRGIGLFYMKYLKKIFNLNPLAIRLSQHFFMFGIFFFLIGSYFQSKSIERFTYIMTKVLSIAAEGFRFHADWFYADIGIFHKTFPHSRIDLLLAVGLSLTLFAFQAFQGDQTVEKYLEKKPVYLRWSFNLFLLFGLIFLRARSMTDGYFYFQF